MSEPAAWASRGPSVGHHWVTARRRIRAGEAAACRASTRADGL